ncbi:hypothetical protein [Streptomyces sp. NPDC060035]|uniref:hypothetical protein n=1 Tax=Streptomyces sp. NPDC060035 TaxID=3347044 RepID=UPI0036823060
MVWLNEAQHYLDAGGGLGERIAAALHSLLTDSAREPVLVLGTLWPEYATAFTTLPQPGGHDPHPQVRELLAGRQTPLPDSFDTTAINRAKALAENGDEQLAHALDHAADGHLTQFLAGAPELLRRYDTASPAARAVLHAAMDARRLGVGLHLPVNFLALAAEDYLTDHELNQASDNWLEQALADLGKTVYGNLAPPCDASACALRAANPAFKQTRRWRHPPTGWRTTSNNMGATSADYSAPRPPSGTAYTITSPTLTGSPAGADGCRIPLE